MQRRSELRSNDRTIFKAFSLRFIATPRQTRQLCRHSLSYACTAGWIVLAAGAQRAVGFAADGAYSSSTTT